MFVDCPYKDKCIDYPYKCDTCARNKGRKSYYIPERKWEWIEKYKHEPRLPKYMIR